MSLPGQIEGVAASGNDGRQFQPTRLAGRVSSCARSERPETSLADLFSAADNVADGPDGRVARSCDISASSCVDRRPHGLAAATHCRIADSCDARDCFGCDTGRVVSVRRWQATTSKRGTALNYRPNIKPFEVEALQRSSAMKTALLRALSHDFRSPLTTTVVSAGATARRDLT
jgi:hypothetical protein